MKCLVTGATGFLGSNLVHELVLDGWDVRASGMHGSEIKYIKDLPIEIVFADITIAKQVEPLVRGCDVVFHAAGDTSFWSKSKQRQRAINVEGSINVAQACMKFGASRMVYTSTTDVLGYDAEGGYVDEENANYNYNYQGFGYNCAETKFQAHKALEKLNQLG